LAGVDLKLVKRPTGIATYASDILAAALEWRYVQKVVGGLAMIDVGGEGEEVTFTSSKFNETPKQQFYENE
jgi:hypothetical protein